MPELPVQRMLVQILFECFHVGRRDGSPCPGAAEQLRRLPSVGEAPIIVLSAR